MGETTTATEPLDALRAPFPKEQVGILPKPYKKDAVKGHCNECGKYHGLPAVHLDYVGHGAVTERLLDIDPEWNWEPMAFDEHGLPRFTLDGQHRPIGLWIRLTVCGVTRLGFGSVAGGVFDAEKQLIGDALRNAAMRFGVALDLWVKGQAPDDESVAAADDRSGPDRAQWTAGRAKRLLVELVGKDDAVKCWEVNAAEGVVPDEDDVRLWASAWHSAHQDGAS